MEPNNPIAAQAALAKLSRATATPNLPDPRPVYKAGQEPRRIHSADLPAWLAQGWSLEPEAEAETVEQTEVDPPAEEQAGETIADETKATTRRKTTPAE